METSSKTQLGITGKEGTVFQETIDGVQYAQKVFKPKKAISRVKREAEFQKLAAQHGIAPEIIEVNTSSPPSFTMEKMDKTVIDVINEQDGELTEEQQKKILSLYQKMDEIKLLHNDSNPLNLMIVGEEWKLIDYGMSKKITKEYGKKHDNIPNLKVGLRFLLNSTKGLITRKILKKEPTILLDAFKRGSYE